MKRGEVWWAALPGLRRPVVVVQSNPFNDSRIGTVMVAIVTSNLALEAAPGNVRVGRGDSGLPKASVVNVSQVLTIDRALLRQRTRALPAAIMNRIDEGLRLALAL